jgi:stage II sporulation protein D
MKTLQHILLISFTLYLGCSGSERYTTKNKEPETVSLKNEVRLLIDEGLNQKQIEIGSDCFLFINGEKEAAINSGEVLYISIINGNLSLSFNSNYYEAEKFELIPLSSSGYLVCNGLKLRGKLKIINNINSVALINTVDLESYLKGVIPREMPLGNGEENYEALKAFAICARTYSLMQLKPENYFDLYIDVKDQVYGGVNVEQPISNRAVDETKNLILTSDAKPAIVFYHSTCGGKTENVKNIFENVSVFYLSGVIDGFQPYCSISPSFEWEEVYTSEVFVERLKNEKLITPEYDILENVFVVNRFESGRINELNAEFSSSLNGKKISITLQGNSIRSILRTADNNGTLRSIWFDINIDEEMNIIINGRGYGHGVGLCQWGSIAQSQRGKTYKQILDHYFPGTEIEKIK